MHHLTLSRRLTLAFATLLLTACVLLGWLQVKTSAQYSQSVIQQLSSGLAQHINQTYPLLGQEGVNKVSLHKLFDNLMTVNPSVEVYLLDKQGKIIGDAAPEGHIKRDRVNPEPLQRAILGEPFPLYGDDPRSLSGKKVFSVAPMLRNGQPDGYLYVILLGEKYNHLAQDAQFDSILTISLLLIAVIGLSGLVMGALAFRWITRPLRQLSRQVKALETGGMDEMHAMAALPLSCENDADELHQLRQGVILMARRISDQWHSLTQQDQLRREFIANISHDLRTPLTSLHGYLESLSVMSARLSDAEKKRYLDTALAQSQKVGMLAQSLFELARLEYGVVKPVKEPFSLSELTQDVFQKFELMAHTHHIQLLAEMPPELPLISADVSMIERVLTNLLDNAIRHTPDDGNVRVHLWLTPGWLMVEVSDSGPGIQPALKEGLFIRPAMADVSRRSEGGLGLMIVRQMLQLHGGDIKLVESPGRGACFRFGLPL